MIGPKAAVGRAIFERARDRGELREGVDLDLLAPALAGICLHRLFLLGLPPDQDTIRSVVDQIILPAALAPRARRPRPCKRTRNPPCPTTSRSTTAPTTTPSPADAEGPASSLGLALVLISIAQLMVVLDATIANIALPFIGKDLDITGTNLTWIVTGYSLVFGGLLLLGGRLADLYGRRRDLHDRPGGLRGRLAARWPRHQTRRCCSAPVASRASVPHWPPPRRSR